MKEKKQIFSSTLSILLQKIHLSPALLPRRDGDEEDTASSAPAGAGQKKKKKSNKMKRASSLLVKTGRAFDGRDGFFGFSREE